MMSYDERVGAQAAYQAASRYPPTPSTPAGIPPIPSNLNELEAGINQIDAEVGELRARLTPVLAPEPPPDMGLKTGNAAPIPTRHSERLRDLTIRLHHIHNALVAIRERVEV